MQHQPKGFNSAYDRLEFFNGLLFMGHGARLKNEHRSYENEARAGARAEMARIGGGGESAAGF